jgi:hypothetical protein
VPTTITRSTLSPCGLGGFAQKAHRGLELRGGLRARLEVGAGEDNEDARSGGVGGEGDFDEVGHGAPAGSATLRSSWEALNAPSIEREPFSQMI